MTDLPLPHPLDDQAADLLDAGLDAPAGDPALAARLAELRAVRAALADLDAVTPAPDPARRESSILAALAAFDEQGAPVVPIRVAAERRDARRERRAWMPAVAAAAVLLIGIVGVRQVTRTSTSESSDSGAFSLSTAAAGKATTGAGAAEAASADDVGGAAAATTAAGAASTEARAAAAATTAAGASATTVAAAPVTSLAAAPILAAPLPYLGEIGSRAELDRAYAALTGSTSSTATTAAASAGGSEAREAMAAVACPLDPPLALLRWQGRPAALTAGDRVRVVVLDDCGVVYERPR